MSNDKNPKDLKADVKQDEGGKPSSNPASGSSYSQGAKAGGKARPVPPDRISELLGVRV